MPIRIRQIGLDSCGNPGGGGGGGGCGCCSACCGGAFVKSFDNTDLVGGILTVTHGLGTKYVDVSVYDENDTMIVPDDVVAVSSTVVDIYLTSFTVVPTWNLLVISATGGGGGIPGGPDTAIQFNDGGAFGGEAVFAYDKTNNRVHLTGSLSQGYQTTILNDYAHAEGENTTASGPAAHAEGHLSIASNDYAHAEGESTTASGLSSHAEGYLSTASGDFSHAEGEKTLASGYVSHAEGYLTTGSNNYSHAEGKETEAAAEYSHAEGKQTLTNGEAAHAEGYLTTGSGDFSHAEGYLSITTGIGSHAEGISTLASGDYSHAEGGGTFAIGDFSHAEGESNQAEGRGSHAEGGSTRATGIGSHAEGIETIAGGTGIVKAVYCHSEGYRTKAAGLASHAEGAYTSTGGDYSHAEGFSTLVTRTAAHAEGYLTTGSGIASHAEGHGSEASGDYSHAGGYYTVAAGYGQTVVGRRNNSTETQSTFTIGNGYSLGPVNVEHDLLRSYPGTAGAGYVQVTGSVHTVNEISISTFGSLVTHGVNRGIRLTDNPSGITWLINPNGIDPGGEPSDSLVFSYVPYTGPGGSISPDPLSSTSEVQGYIALLTPTPGTWVQMNFTGQHRCLPYDKRVDEYANKTGLIVVSSGDYSNPITDKKITINDSTPLVKLSTKRNDKKVLGIVSDIEDTSNGKREFGAGNFISVMKANTNDSRLFINSLGEGAIWICNINGNFENGDYITTCEVPGYGMKQDDDLLHNYTVAKITCDCDFDLNSDLYKCEEFIHEGKTYRRAFVGCTYHCG